MDKVSFSVSLDAKVAIEAAKYANDNDMSRSEAINELVKAGLKQLAKETVAAPGR